MDNTNKFKLGDLLKTTRDTNAHHDGIKRKINTLLIFLKVYKYKEEGTHFTTLYEVYDIKNCVKIYVYSDQVEKNKWIA